MGLKELGCLVEGIELLALLGLLFVHNCLKSFALSALLDTLCPLLSNLTQLILSILAICLSLLLFLCLLSHLGIVRVERLCVLLICTIVLSQQCSFSTRICRFHIDKLIGKLLNRLLQILHGFFVSFLHGGLDLFTISSQLILTSVLLSAKFALGQFKVVDFDAAGFFVLLCVLRELFKLILLVVQCLIQVFNTAARCLDLLLHAVVLLERRRKFGHPKLTHLLKLKIEASNVAALCQPKFSLQLILQLLVLEDLHELHNVCFHLNSVALGFVLGSL